MPVIASLASPPDTISARDERTEMTGGADRWAMTIGTADATAAAARMPAIRTGKVNMPWILHPCRSIEMCILPTTFVVWTAGRTFMRLASRFPMQAVCAFALIASVPMARARIAAQFGAPYGERAPLHAPAAIETARTI